MEPKTQAATPESTTEERHCLVPPLNSSMVPPSASQRPELSNPKPWYRQYPPPFGILSTSVLQLIMYGVATDKIERILRFEPNNHTEAWRYVTYMFIHRNLFHVLINVVIQCLFAFTLEKYQNRLLVLTLYFGSGAIGALSSSCVRPDLVVGASAGVYGLLISNLSHIALNYNSTKYKLWAVLTVIIIVASDATFYLIYARNQENVIISEGAHIGGGIAGLILGLLLYRSKDEESKKRNRFIFWSIFAIFAILMSLLVAINFMIKKCTPAHRLRVSYTYVC
uniref:Peptidase S54 rhomboid domain-containing protein n=1 Tax=Photinus pyralis TaxID=7054 RepID=A0A1Y1KX41_PHOPY